MCTPPVPYTGTQWWLSSTLAPASCAVVEGSVPVSMTTCHDSVLKCDDMQWTPSNLATPWTQYNHKPRGLGSISEMKGGEEPCIMDM